MLEIVISSLAIGGLGLEAIVASWWMRQQQVVPRPQEAEEEERLTTYESPEDRATITESSPNGNGKSVPSEPPATGWEFKIVRANRDLFRNPAIFQHLCEEEAQAGWVMVEKLDDRRVRFKRPMALRELINSDHLTYDPYRCHYGSSFSAMSGLGAIAAILAIVVPAYAGYYFASEMLGHSRSNSRTAPSQPWPVPERSP